MELIIVLSLIGLVFVSGMILGKLS